MSFQPKGDRWESKLSRGFVPSACRKEQGMSAKQSQGQSPESVVKEIRRQTRSQFEDGFTRGASVESYLLPAGDIRTV